MFKRGCILFLFLLLSFGLRARVDSLMLHLTGISLQFLQHKDSLPFLKEIGNARICPERDSIMSAGEPINSIDEFYGKHIQQYQLNLDHKGLKQYVSLYFCYNRLIQVNIYSSDSLRRRKILAEIEGFKAKLSYSGSYYADSVKQGDSLVWNIRNHLFRINGKYKNLSFRYRAYTNKNFSTLVLCPNDVMDKMPSWCGNCNGKNTWEALRVYMEKRAPERKRRRR